MGAASYLNALGRLPCPRAVETRSNGHDALSLLREKNDDLATDQFDLVLSDVYMPGAAPRPAALYTQLCVS